MPHTGWPPPARRGYTPWRADLQLHRRPRMNLRDSSAIQWTISDRLVDYAAAVRVMEARAAAIADGRAPELVWLLEHPPLYTAGTSARHLRSWRNW